MSNKKLLILSTIIITIFLYSFFGNKGDVVENFNVPVAIGCDLKNVNEDNVNYNIPVSSYIFEDSGEIISETFTGTGKSIGETRGNRQLKSNKKFLLGVERVFVVGENYARNGIRTILDILINNPQNNDIPHMVVCNGTAEDILKYKLKGYPNSGEFIDGLIKNSHEHNFFSQKYTIMDVIKKIDAEGCDLLLPYIEVKDKNIELTGLAIFKKDKMIATTTIDEAKTINLLKENSVKCMLTIQDTPEKYINYYAKSKRKVNCYKNGDKYKFVINLSLNGSVVSNLLYKDLNTDLKVLEKFTSDMENQIKAKCDSFILKSKSKYEIDLFDLGMVAASKYGRKTGVDWDEIISNSDIEVNVKVKVDTEGRGHY